MIEWLTIDALLACADKGKVNNKPSQDFVRIAQRIVLIEPDPEGRSISNCPNNNVMMGMKPCTSTLKVQTGYSTFVRISGKRVCLSTVEGLTDGSPAGAAKYNVLKPGQTLVVAAS
jgi:hypothetical protein